MGRLFLAAGHFPAAPGAGHDGFVEHDEAERWVALIRTMMSELEGPGQQLVYVPTGTLKSKTDFINARLKPGDVAAELHFNSFEGNPFVDGKGPDGCVALYEPGSERGRSLAEAIQSRMSKVFPPDRGVEEGWYRGDRARGLYWFLDRTICPAVILEPEFIQRRTQIQENRKAGCQAIVDGVAEYMRGA